MRSWAWALALVVTLGACRGVGGGASEWVWYPKEPHAALVDGAWVRAREPRYILPAMRESFVGARGLTGHVETEAELLAQLKPVTTGEGALAVLELVQKVAVTGEQLEAIRWSRPLEFEPEDPDSTITAEAYRPADAERWNVPTEPAIEITPEGVVVKRPVWRPLREGEVEGDQPLGEEHVMMRLVLPSVVEYVADTVARNGKVERTVLRVLVSGPAAKAYGPLPLF